MVSLNTFSIFSGAGPVVTTVNCSCWARYAIKLEMRVLFPELFSQKLTSVIKRTFFIRRGKGRFCDANL